MGIGDRGLGPMPINQNIDNKSLAIIKYFNWIYLIYNYFKNINS